MLTSKISVTALPPVKRADDGVVLLVASGIRAAGALLTADTAWWAIVVAVAIALLSRRLSFARLFALVRSLVLGLIHGRLSSRRAADSNGRKNLTTGAQVIADRGAFLTPF